MEPAEKVTENFTGKEKDDETELNYFGARYLDPMLGLWMSVDPARQFSSPYLYAGNGVNPVNGVDGDGKRVVAATKGDQYAYAKFTRSLNSEQRELLYEIEKDENFILNFHTNNGVFYRKLDPYDPNKVEVMNGILVANEEIGVHAFICVTCENSQETFVHEVIGHGKQVQDFLNGGKLTGENRSLKDWPGWSKKMNLS